MLHSAHAHVGAQDSDSSQLAPGLRAVDATQGVAASVSVDAEAAEFEATQSMVEAFGNSLQSLQAQLASAQQGVPGSSCGGAVQAKITGASAPAVRLGQMTTQREMARAAGMLIQAHKLNLLELSNQLKMLNVP